MKQNAFFKTSVAIFTMAAAFPLSMYAQFSGQGEGTASNPYLIKNEIQLSQMANFLNNSNVVFQLQNDIDLTEFIEENSPKQGWMPIGVESSPFKGTLNGKNHKISGISINRASETNVGFFGFLSEAKINDLTIEAKKYVGSTNIGALAGSINGATINNCHVVLTGELEAVTNDTIGGFAGCCIKGNFNGCSFSGNLTGKNYIGGFIGYSGTPILNNCTSRGNITATGNYIGGLIGGGKGVPVEKMDGCSFVGIIDGGSFVGGLIGGYTAEEAQTGHHYQIRYSGIVGNASSMLKNPTLSNTSTGYGYDDDIYEKVTLSNTTYTKNISNCTSVGNIKGKKNVGGLLGSDNSNLITTGKTSQSKYYSTYPSGSTHQYDAFRYVFCDGVYTGQGGAGWYTSLSVYYYDYTVAFCDIDINNSSFSGDVNGTENVGGLVGSKSGGSLHHNIVYADVQGASNVGGIVGKIDCGPYSSFKTKATIESNVACNFAVSAAGNSIGRIYGYSQDNSSTLGALGTAKTNRGLTRTKIIQNGMAKDVDDDLQNGTTTGPAFLRMKDNYVAWGWDFDKNWTILDSESYPYKQYQTAPPAFDGKLEARSTAVTGTSVDGGTVYLYYNGLSEPATSICDEDKSFVIDTEPLIGESTVKLTAEASSKIRSYFIFGSVEADNGTVDIITVKNSFDRHSQVYSLSGQRLATPKKGINIVGGKKIIVK